MIKEIIRRLVYKLFLFYRKDSKSQILFLNDSIGLEIMFNGFYEKSNLEVLKKSFPLNIINSTFLDIGANIGNHAVFFKDSFKYIKCFEPQKKFFKY